MARLSFIVCVLFAAVLNISAEPFVSKELIVTLNHGGSLVGRHMTSLHGRSFRAFLGIPYANPPIGNLRFSAPEPADAWNGTRMAIDDNKICAQVDVFFSHAVFSGIEDCLYLNVYAPQDPKTKGPLPVMVWIHGGGFIMGAGIKAIYGPQFFMDRDIVLVSINYRVGTLGFLSSETTDLSGNFGLKDQVLALKWVQENIAAFGGNPQSVTIFGESAGGASVNYLTISKQAKGLFHRGITLSGSSHSPWAEPAPKGYAAEQAQKVVEKVGCNVAATWAEKLECLRKVDYKVLAEIGNTFWEFKYFPLPTFPIVVEPEHETAFLTHSLEAIDYSNAVPLIMGYTSDEGLLLTKFNDILKFEEVDSYMAEQTHLMWDYKLAAKEYHPMIKQSINQYYFPNGKVEEKNFTDILSDRWFLQGIDKLLQQRLVAKAPTYFYTFEHNGLSFVYRHFNSFAGTSHADDLLYMFPLNELFLPTVIKNKRDADITDIFIDLWTNFATYGDPTPTDSKLPKWPAVDVDSYPPKMLQIGNKNDDAPLLQISDKYPKARMEFWQSLEPYLVKQPVKAH